MGIVFKAEHVLLRRVVALKVLPLSRDQDTRMLRRFLTEMRTVASLQHPNIVAATDAGQVHPAEPNLPVLHYLAMEFIEGRDLEELVAADGPLEPAIACDLIHQVASALAEAHGHNLVHRDIKPGNVIVSAANQAKLLDFGLARDFAGQMTDPGSLLGTIDYMSPEQAQNPSAVDIRADIYGLGATLFWCLTGKVPFPAQSTLSQQIARRLCEPPPSARARRPEIPPELDAVITQMLASDADDFIAKPFGALQLRGRVKSVLRLNDALKRIDQLGHHARTLAHDLERAVEGRQTDSRQARSALVQGLVASYLFRTDQS